MGTKKELILWHEDKAKYHKVISLLKYVTKHGQSDLLSIKEGSAAYAGSGCVQNSESFTELLKYKWRTS